MSKLNLLVYLNAYGDSNSSNNPSMSNFKWTREIDTAMAGNPVSEEFDLAPGESKTLFNGSRTLLQDGSTQYSLSLKALTSNTYVLSAVSGTLPNFRTPRSTGADATTQITITLNGPLAIFTSTGGTSLSLGAVQVGDYVRIGNLFSPLNQGEFKILSKTSNSFTVENQSAGAEGPITLGAGFAVQLQIYSSIGVQKNDTLVISDDFSLVTQGSYKVTDVAANYLEFYSTEVLPQESNVETTAIALYSAAKNLVYAESDQKVSISINGSAVANLEPFIINNSRQPGIFMLKSTVWSMAITNVSLDDASLFVASVE